MTISLGLLVARIVVGLLMAAHGTQKLFGWFGGYGLQKTGEFFAQLGFRPGRAFAAAASITELTSGLLIAFGFLGPIGPALMISVMIVAVATVHWGNGLFATTNGVEVPVLYSTAGVALSLVGFGSYSLDASLGLTSLWTYTITLIALAIGISGGIANLALRSRPATTVRA